MTPQQLLQSWIDSPAAKALGIPSITAAGITVTPTPVPAIASIVLWDITKNSPAAMLPDGLSLIPSKATIRVAGSGFKTLRMQLLGPTNVDHTEGIAPYDLNGDSVPVAFPNGSYTLTLTPDMGSPTTIHFSVNVPAPIPPPAPPTPSKCVKGIVTGLSAGFAALDPIFKDLGVTGIRCWEDIDWSKPFNSAHFDEYRKYKNAGYEVTICFTTKTVPTPTQASAWYSSVVQAAAGAVSYWEIGNEPNLSNYWNGSLAQYLQTHLFPAYGVLHAAGQKVISAGISEDTNALKNLIGIGLLSFCDAVGFHPYGSNTAQNIQRVQIAKSLVGAKPLHLTEWNIHGATPASWAGSLNDMWTGAAPLCESISYYRSVVSGQFAGVAGAVNTDLSKHQPYYDAVKSLL